MPRGELTLRLRFYFGSPGVGTLSSDFPVFPELFIKILIIFRGPCGSWEMFSAQVSVGLCSVNPCAGDSILGFHIFI